MTADNVVRTSRFQDYGRRTNPRRLADATEAAPFLFAAVEASGDPRLRAQPVADPEGAYFASLLARLG